MEKARRMCPGGEAFWGGNWESNEINKIISGNLQRASVHQKHAVLKIITTRTAALNVLQIAANSFSDMRILSQTHPHITAARISQFPLNSLHCCYPFLVFAFPEFSSCRGSTSPRSPPNQLIMLNSR